VQPIILARAVSSRCPASFTMVACVRVSATPPPSERVALILGRDEEDDDDDHHTHEIFCELEELRLHAGDDAELEWKETAR